MRVYSVIAFNVHLLKRTQLESRNKLKSYGIILQSLQHN